MQKKATIIGTQEGEYLACLEEERKLYDCDEQCRSCAYPCRVILKKDQPIENGRRVLCELEQPLIEKPAKLGGVLVGIYAVFFVLMLFFKSVFAPNYQGMWPVVMSGFFAALIFYLVLKIKQEKSGGEDRLRRGKIVRVYSRDA